MSGGESGSEGGGRRCGNETDEKCKRSTGIKGDGGKQGKGKTAAERR